MDGTAPCAERLSPGSSRPAGEAQRASGELDANRVEPLKRWPDFVAFLNRGELLESDGLGIQLSEAVVFSLW